MDQLTYIGHATTLLRLDGVAILTDPMPRDWLGPLRRQGRSPDPLLAEAADLVLGPPSRSRGAARSVTLAGWGRFEGTARPCSCRIG